MPRYRSYYFVTLVSNGAPTLLPMAYVDAADEPVIGSDRHDHEIFRDNLDDETHCTCCSSSCTNQGTAERLGRPSFRNTALLRQTSVPSIGLTPMEEVIDMPSFHVHRGTVCDQDDNGLCTLSQLRNNGLFVKTVVNGVTARFLVDTGCGPTILNSQIFEKMCSSTKPQLQGLSTELKVADGQPMPCMGKGKFRMNIDDMTVEHEMLVADIDVEGLLGWEFLCKHECNLNIRAGKLTIGKLTDGHDE